MGTRKPSLESERGSGSDLIFVVSGDKAKSLPQGVVVGLIRFYQKAISPSIPHSCRFRPTCSDYAIHSIEKHGILRGSLRSFMRILRCNPFNPGGYDPVR